MYEVANEWTLWHCYFQIFLFLFAKMFAFTKFCLFIFCLVNFCDKKTYKNYIHKYINIHILLGRKEVLWICQKCFLILFWCLQEELFINLCFIYEFFLIKTEYFCSKIVASSQWQLWFPPQRCSLLWKNSYC